MFAAKLRKGCIRLKDEVDSLVQALDKDSRKYSTRLGHKVLITHEEQEKVSQFPKFWKIKAPQKTNIFLWLALQNRIFTWDLLQKKGKNGHTFSIYVEEQNTILEI